MAVPVSLHATTGNFAKRVGPVGLGLTVGRPMNVSLGLSQVTTAENARFPQAQSAGLFTGGSRTSATGGQI